MNTSARLLLRLPEVFDISAVMAGQLHLASYFSKETIQVAIPGLVASYIAGLQKQWILQSVFSSETRRHLHIIHIQNVIFQTHLLDSQK